MTFYACSLHWLFSSHPELLVDQEWNAMWIHEWITRIKTQSSTRSELVLFGIRVFSWEKACIWKTFWLTNGPFPIFFGFSSPSPPPPGKLSKGSIATQSDTDGNFFFLLQNISGKRPITELVLLLAQLYIIIVASFSWVSRKLSDSVESYWHHKGVV